jgi:hypothetical protein
MLAFVSLWTTLFTFGLRVPADPWIMIVAYLGWVLVVVMLINVLECWKTAYGLTDRRLIIVVGKRIWWGSTQSYGPEDIEPLRWTGGGDWGSVFFGETLGEGGWAYKDAFYV